MNKNCCRNVGFALVLTLLVLPVQADAPAGDGVSLTVYRDGIAVVDDERRFDLEVGSQWIAWAGIPESVAPGGLRFRPGPGVTWERTDWRAEVPDARRLMATHVGDEVYLRRDNVRRPEAVTIVSADPPLVRGRHGVESVDPARLVYPGFADLPGREERLQVRVHANEAGETRLRAQYAVAGLDWRADHDAVINEDGTEIEIVGRATLINRTGTDFVADSVDIVAGDMRLPDADRPQADQTMRLQTAEAAMPAPETVDDYYRFALGSVDLPAGHRSVVPLLRRTASLERDYVARVSPGVVRPQRATGDDGWTPLALETRMAWRNVGGPLPAGIIRVYRADGEGREVLTGGGDTVDVADGEMLHLSPGRPFDITASQRQTRFERVGEREIESEQEVRIRNARDVDVHVRIEVRGTGEWDFLSASDDWQRPSADLAWRSVRVPAGDSRTVSYALRSRY